MADDKKISEPWGAKSYTATGGKGPWASRFNQLFDSMTEQAAGIQAEEERRYGEGLGVLTKAFTESQEALKPIDPDLLFSKAADTVGARSRTAIETLRGSLGSRGLSANSGAAQGTLARLAMAQEGDLIGAARDIAINNQRQRQVNAATNFANALNLAAYTNAPVSGIGYENTQNILEGFMSLYGINKARESQDAASRSGLLGSLIGGGGSILGSLIPGL